MADIYYGKGLASKELYDEIYATCNFPEQPDVTPNSPNYAFQPSEACEALLSKQSQEVGPHNVYNIYDVSVHTTRRAKPPPSLLPPAPTPPHARWSCDCNVIALQGHSRLVHYAIVTDHRTARAAVRSSRRPALLRISCMRRSAVA
jgi:hypothetical protein